MSRKPQPTQTDPLRQRLRRFHARLRRRDARTRTLHVVVPPGARVESTVDAFLADARAAGTRVVEASCQTAVAAPFALVRDWLAAGDRPSESVFAVLGGGGAAGEPDDDRADQPWSETLMAFAEAVRRALHTMAGGEPLLLVLHDAQRADADARALLDHLAGRLGLPGAAKQRTEERIRIGLLLVFAPEGEADAVALDGDAPLGVERFEAPPVAQEAFTEALADDEVRDALQRLARGDPLRLRALLRVLGRDAEAAVALAFEGLRGDERRVLEALALLDRPAHVAELRAALTLTPERAATALTRLAAGGGVRRHGERIGLGPLFAVADVRERMEPPEKVALHRALANALGAAEVEPWVEVARDEEVARHLLDAGAVEDGLPRAIAAAGRLNAAGAPRRAAALLALAERHAAGATRTNGASAVRADVQERLAELDEAEAIRRRLFDEARGGPDEVPAALRLGGLLLRRGRPDEAVEVLDTGRRAARAASPDLAARLGAMLAEGLLRCGDPERAERVARSALAEARLQAQPAAALAAGQALGKALAALGNAEEAADVFRRTLDEAEAQGRERDSARASYNLGVLALHRGAVSEARRLLERCLDASERCGLLLGVGLALTNLAVVHAHNFRLGEAIAAMHRAVAVFEDLEQDDRLAVALADLSTLLVQVGDLRAAARAAARARGIAEAMGSERLAAYCALREAEVALEEGRGARAESGFRQVEPVFAGQGAVLDRGWALVGLARVAAERRDAGAALAHLESLEALPLDPSSELRGIAALVRARLLLGEGQEDAAEVALDEAVAALESAGRPVYLAEAISRKAALVARRGDPKRAQELYEEARAQLEETANALPEPLRASFRARRPVSLVLAAARRAAQATAEDQPTNGAVEAELPTPGRSGALLVGDEWRARFPDILGESRGLRRVLQMIDRFAPVDATVLLLGESGTGKELVARALFQHSNRKTGPYVRINAAALTETLLLSELFGHEKGAFTGAVQRVKGAFEAAHGGTLFLDEIGDISPAAQVSLLRVLQEREILRVGGTRPVPTDVRVICATNRDLEQLVADGRFRLDLYHRIRGLHIGIPPLRDRPEDIAPLAGAALDDVARELGHPVGLAEDALTLLQAQAWQGNVRELQNVLRSVAVVTDADLLRARDLVQHAGLDPAAVRSPSFELDARPTGDLAAVLPDLDDGFSLDQAKRQLEVLCIRRALARTGGNITRAAGLLGMKRPRLSQKIKELGIVVPR